MKLHKFAMLGAVAAFAFCIAPAIAGNSVAVKVPGSAMPWDINVNAKLSFGKGDGTPPVAATGFKLVPGSKIKVTANGSTTTVAGGGSFGPNGQADFVTDAGLGNSGLFFPSKFVSPNSYPTKLNMLIGAFVNARGQLVALPFAVGDSEELVVPDNAAAIEFGINDDIFAENTGELDVTVEQE